MIYCSMFKSKPRVQWNIFDAWAISKQPPQDYTNLNFDLDLSD